MGLCYCSHSGAETLTHCSRLSVVSTCKRALRKNLQTLGLIQSKGEVWVAKSWD
jgi:hypothetical protein